MDNLIKEELKNLKYEYRSEDNEECQHEDCDCFFVDNGE
jgi:hypothetical protein